MPVGERITAAGADEWRVSQPIDNADLRRLRLRDIGQPGGNRLLPLVCAAPTPPAPVTQEDRA